MPFTPEYSVPTLRAFYSRFRPRIWTAYGFRDAFNIGAGWYDTDELGIDQGPIVIMIENYRTQRVWQLFMQNAEVQRGLQRAGFVPLPFMALNLQAVPAQGAFNLSWSAASNRYYQVEYSPELATWAAARVPSAKVTLIVFAPSTTWLAVRMEPSLLTMMPVPTPKPPSLPLLSSVRM
jgi:hypothetical protein